jgi:hypothetical protein
VEEVELEGDFELVVGVGRRRRSRRSVRRFGVLGVDKEGEGEGEDLEFSSSHGSS